LTGPNPTSGDGFDNEAAKRFPLNKPLYLQIGFPIAISE
jgi:hypothetical protein